jgi:membrane-associated phospholipid phosphatase
MADQAAISRLYAGIHFASDTRAGLALGRRVAEVALRRVAQSTQQRR